MKQKFRMKRTYKQTFQLNQKMIHSLDFLKLNSEDMQSLIDNALQTNPFLELRKAYDPSNHSYIENISNHPSLQEELYHQLYACLKSYDSHIMSYLIESLNDRGFLSYSYDVYLKELQIDENTFFKHLELLQSFEPAGVAASDAIDSICIQLKRKGKENAYCLMKKYKDIILTQNYHQIKQTTHLTQREIDILFEDIKQCQPFPCQNYSNQNDIYVLPDIDIIIENENIQIVPINQPNVMVNDHLYQSVRDNEDMKNFFNEAHFLLENLTKRNKTVLMVANELVDLQKSYFLYNDELVSCTLADLAQKCGFHESTISRTLHHKYYRFNNEVYPLKNLLVSKTLSGDSSDSIKKAIVLLIHNEDKQKPLTDEAIVSKLEELDLYCSRRVIVKYRQQLNIPSSSKRKRK